MSNIQECNICYNELNNKIICDNCSKNKDDPKYICSNCIIKLNIYRIFLYKDNNLIEDEDIKKNITYDDILIQYTCPYCKSLCEYKLKNIIDKEQIIYLCIVISKYLLFILYTNQEYINKLIQDNISLKKKIKLYNNNFSLNIFLYNKYSIIFGIIVFNTVIFVLIIIIQDIIN